MAKAAKRRWRRQAAFLRRIATEDSRKYRAELGKRFEGWANEARRRALRKAMAFEIADHAALQCQRIGGENAERDACLAYEQISAVAATVIRQRLSARR